ncbi:MAG: type IX secretion system membrane protein PorP/SprF [Bacteroidetes bacterium]|nr:type IX secretion system membrane protein PorP/SprF [Bacteroidota bacterium]
MVKKLSCVVMLIFLVLTGQVAKAQDPIFSQFYANPLYLNPALAGSVICPRLSFNYRNQWPAIAGTYVTYNASYDQYWDKISGGVGFLAMSDRAGEGALTTNTFSGIYSYRLVINRKLSLNAGFQASYFQRRIDWDKLTFPDMIDPKYGFVNNTMEKQPPKLSIGFADFSSGLLLSHSESFFAGVAVHHLTQPNEGFYSDISSKLNMKLTVHAGGIIDLRRRSRGNRSLEDPTLSPNILYQQQQHFQQLNYGVYFNRYPFVGGLWFRQNFNNPDAFILLAGFEQPSFKLGYSYDLTVSKLTNITGGAHEVSFSWLFPCPIKKKKVRAINCPSF